MEENFCVFDFRLDEADMEEIAALDEKKSVFFSPLRSGAGGAAGRSGEMKGFTAF